MYPSWNILDDFKIVLTSFVSRNLTRTPTRILTRIKIEYFQRLSLTRLLRILYLSSLTPILKQKKFLFSKFYGLHSRFLGKVTPLPRYQLAPEVMSVPQANILGQSTSQVFSVAAVHKLELFHAHKFY